MHQLTANHGGWFDRKCGCISADPWKHFFEMCDYHRDPPRPAFALPPPNWGHDDRAKWNQPSRGGIL